MWSEVMELFTFPSRPEGEVTTCLSGLKQRCYCIVSERKMFPSLLTISCPFGTKSMDFLVAAPGFHIIFGNPVDNCKVKTGT